MVKPWIVKIGGSVITDKKRPFTVRKRDLSRLAHEVSKCKSPLIVVHGGGSFGHPIADRYKLKEGYRHPLQRTGIALTRLAMNRLNACVVYALYSAGVPAISVQPSACMTLKNGKIASADLKPLMKMLELGMVPVLYGDVVPDIARGVSILSGDSIVAYLARKLRAERVIVGVDVDGVYTANPKIRKDARLLRVITPTTWRKLSFTADEETKDVTGGMGYKIKELLELAKIGIESEIVNALKPGVVRRVLTGKKGLGTIVRGEQK